jgi:hypothetical protein
MGELGVWCQPDDATLNVGKQRIAMSRVVGCLTNEATRYQYRIDIWIDGILSGQISGTRYFKEIKRRQIPSV